MWKSKVLKLTLFLGVVLGVGFSVMAGEARAGTIYYVDKDCVGGSTSYSSANNACTGGSERVYETIQACVNAISAGETCLIRAGTYFERVSFTKSGSVFGDLILKAYSGEDVIVDGSRPLPAGTWSETVTGSTVYQRAGFTEKVGALFDASQSEYREINHYDNHNAGSGLCVEVGNTVGRRADQKNGLTTAECRQAIISNTYDNNWFKGMQAPPNATMNAYYLFTDPYYANGSPPTNRDINYVWAFDAKMMHNAPGDLLYLAFEDDSNPTTKTLRWSPPYSGVITTSGHEYITFDGIIVRGGAYGIDASASNHIALKNSKVYVARYGWYQNTGGGTNTIQNNRFVYKALMDNDATGAYEGCSGSPDNIESCRKHEYTYHFWHAEYGGTDNASIRTFDIRDAGGNFLIDNNVIAGGYDGMLLTKHVGNMTISNNTCIEGVSVCIMPEIWASGAAATTWKINGNLLTNANIGLRFLNWDESFANRPAIYVYNNKFWGYGNPNDIYTHGLGTGVYFHYMFSNAQSMPINDLWFYHNTFAGLASVLSWGSVGPEDKPYDQTKAHYINNILSTNNRPFNNVHNDNSFIKDCDYNYITGDKKDDWRLEMSHSCVSLSGNVNHNICRGMNIGECSGTVAAPLWDNTSMPFFDVVGTLTENAGIDISKTFTLNGQSYPALPGFTVGYAGVDGRPNIGAVFNNPADVNSDGSVNIKDIQACIRVITGADMTYENQCKVLAAPDVTTNIKDIQVIVSAIVNQ